MCIDVCMHIFLCNYLVVRDMDMFGEIYIYIAIKEK